MSRIARKQGSFKIDGSFLVLECQDSSFPNRLKIDRTVVTPETTKYHVSYDVDIECTQPGDRYKTFCGTDYYQYVVYQSGSEVVFELKDVMCVE